MTNKEQFIAEKMKILVGKENYSRSQAYAIANSYWQKEMQKAQQGGYAQEARFNQTVPNYNFTVPNINQLPNQEYDFNYNGFNPQPVQNNTQFGQPSTFSNYTVPEQPTQPIQSFQSYNQAQNTQDAYNNSHNPNDYIQGDANGDGVVDAKDKAKNQYVTNSVNIVDPTQGFGNPMYNLNRGMYNFGRGNTLGGVAGTGAALFGLARTGLLGYSQGKEDRRIGQEYNEKRFDRTPNYAMGQQGGKIKNSDVIAQNAITDQEGNTNINLEGGGKNKIGEFVMRNNGQVQPVVGEPHIRNGKKADGVDAQLEDGDKVLSNYVKLRPTDIKDLKERYDISLKRGATFAEAQKKLDQKLGIKKLETEKADILEKLEKANKIKDTSTKQLSLEVLSKKTGEVNEKLNTLSGVRASNFEHLFQLQEQQPKKGDGSQLFDKNGKEVTESNEGVAQQGGNFESIAQKYGISPERARELVMMQSGGEMPQEEAQQEPAQQDQMQQVFQAVAQIIQEGQEDPIAFLMEQGATEEEAQQVVAQVAQQMQGGQEQAQSQGQGSQQELVQMVAEALQSGAQPEEIMQEMVSQGMPEEAAGQAIQAVMQQMQGGQQTAQQGGQKRYAQAGIVPEYAPITLPKGVSRLGVTPIPDEVWNAGSEEAAKWFLRNAETFANTDSTYKPKFEALKEKLKNVKTDKDRFNVLEQAQAERQQIFKKNYPELSETVGGFYPGTQLGLQDFYDEVKTDKNELKKFETVLKESGISVNNGKIKEGSYRVNALGDKSPLKTYLADAKVRIPKAFKKFAVRNSNDAKWDRRLENFRTVDFENESQKEEYAKKYGLDKVGDFWVDPKNPNNIISPRIKGVPTAGTPPADPAAPESEKTPPYTEQPNQEVEAVNNVKNIPAIFPAFIPPYSPMQALVKESAFIPRYESIKVTPESMLAENATQALNQQYAIEQTGMSPQQQQAVLGRNLYQSQMAANDAISKAEQFNSNNQWQTDNLNTGIRAKEGIMDAQYRQDYQGKVLQTLANKETQDYNNYYSNFMQDQANSNKIVNMNTANALNDQWSITPSGVIPLNNKPYELPKMSIPKSVYDKLSAEEVNAIKKKAIVSGMQLEVV